MKTPHFVESYKVILDVKKTHDKTQVDTHIRYYLIFIGVMLISATFVGLMFDLLNEFNYLFLIINATLFSGLILQKITRHKQFQLESGKKYNIIVAIIIENYHQLIVVLLWQILVYWFYMDFVGYAVILIIGLIALLPPMIIAFLDNLNTSQFILKYLFLGFSYAIVQLTITLMMPLRMMLINYLISSVVVFFIILIKDLSKPTELTRTVIRIHRYFVLIGFLILTMFINESIDKDILFTYEIIAEKQLTIDYYFLDSNLEIQEPSYRHTYYKDDQVILVDYQYSQMRLYAKTYAYIFDRQGEYVDRVLAPVPDFEVMESNQGFYIKILATEIEFYTGTDYNTDEPVNTYVLQLTDQNTFELIYQFDWEQTIDYVYEVDTGIYLFYDFQISYLDIETSVLTQQDMTLLDDVFVDDLDRYYIVKDDRVYTNMFDGTNDPYRYAPFGDYPIINYFDGYGTFHVREGYYNRIYLLDFDEEKVISIPQTFTSPSRILYVDQRYLITNNYDLEAYDLKRDETIDFNEGFFYINQTDHIIIDFKRDYKIEITFLDEGYHLRQTIGRVYDDIFAVIGLIYIAVIYIKKWSKAENYEY